LAPREASSRFSTLLQKGERVSPQAGSAASLEGPLPIPCEKEGRGDGDPKTADQVFQQAVNSVEAILQAVRAQASFSLAPAAEAAEGLIRELKAGDALLVPFFSGGGPLPDLAREAVHVAIISLKIGLELGYAPEELRRLGLVALLHNVGMVRIPEGLLMWKGPLNPEERVVLERHPEEGVRLFRGLGPHAAWLAEAVLQVYERMDGSGYPKGLTGQEICEEAYIVGLADVYESLVHPRPFRGCLGPLEALKEILQRERTAFPDRILKALIRALSAFPVGSLVRLNTGEIGRVVRKNKDFPLRPVVEVFVRGGKQLEEPVVIDLSQSPLLHIQDSVVKEALP